MTRMANAAVLRQALMQAKHYQEQQKCGEAEGKKDTVPDARWDALGPLLRGELPLKIHAHRSDDILTAVRIANEFGLSYTLDHCTEGYLIADLLAEAYKMGLQDGYGLGEPGKGRLVGVITGPIISDRSKPELSRASIENPAALARAGLPMAIMTDHPVIPEQFLALSAAAAIKGGLTPDEALQAITIQAARICGIADERGSLENGKIADLVLFSAHPFDCLCQTRLVLVDGLVAWRDHQTAWPDNLA